MKQIALKKLLLASTCVLGACVDNKFAPVIPALRYSENLRGPTAVDQPDSTRSSINPNTVNNLAELERGDVGTLAPSLRLVSQQNEQPQPAAPEFQTFQSNMRNTREYQGPLSVGDPGVTSSLWRESRATNELFRDNRAYNPMDLITIVIAESAEGKKTADTEVKGSSTVTAAIKNLLGLETKLTTSGWGQETSVDPDSLIDAETTNDFKGEGKTNRKDTLTGKISAMVVEVLPGNILRIEGEKIISVNAEEQIMVISGLVRPRDINSANEVLSSQIANIRIDYYGRGTVGEAQYGGWASRLMRLIWPF